MLLAGALLAPAAAAARELCVATWNIHGGRKLERVRKELSRPPLSGCEVLALQEVLTKEEGAQERRLAAQHAAEAVAAGRDVILSRLPVVSSGSLRINPATGRQAAWADLRASSRSVVRVYSVHLSYKVRRSPFIREIRKEEMARVLEHAAASSGPVVVAGDYNTVGWFVCCHASAPSLRLLRAAGYADALAGARGSTQRFVGPVDWIFVKGLSPARARRGDYAGSDHRWMLSVLEVP